MSKARVSCGGEVGNEASCAAVPSYRQALGWLAHRCNLYGVEFIPAKTIGYSGSIPCT